MVKPCMGLSKERVEELLQIMVDMPTKDLYELANEVDSTLAKYLVVAIKDNMSFNRIEATYGLMPVAYKSFYMKREKMFVLLDKRV